MTIILCAIGIILQALFICMERQKKYVPAVILKGSASLVFVIFGFYCAYGILCGTDATYFALTRRVLLGLILGMIGDILLNLRFVFEKAGQKIFLVGIVFFLAGHISYLLALWSYNENRVAAFVIGMILAAIVLILIFSNIQKVKAAFVIFGIVYISAVVIMTVFSVFDAAANAGVTGFVTFAAGAVLFTASDIVLIFNTFGSKQRFGLRITNLSLYYIGQLLIALSLSLLATV